jgi:TonB family protein
MGFHALSLASLLLAGADSGALPPGTDGTALARATLTSDAASLCPEVQAATPGDRDYAVMLRFLVDAQGMPSQSSVWNSSGSDTLDSVALGCLAKLRFEPTMQDGVTVERWSQMRWVWKATPGAVKSCPAAANENAPVGTSNTKQATAGPPRAIVCVCADDAGKLTRDPVIVESTGTPKLDRAAIELARAGYAHNNQTAGRKSNPGCVKFAIAFEGESRK